ncbi:glycosyltransferase [Estrella lausannensis]|uniref:Glycosyltransferase n=1 Tax=Estrella lausannensis TaxID=483423 RepID=A0A0H5E6I7_9BACT|nr:glycosyltransferase [Estrella lausannensis]CRX38900.1 Glycosyltransferase [Estrella lausannensis]
MRPLFLFFLLFFAMRADAAQGDEVDVRILSFPSKAGFVKDVRILEESLDALGYSHDSRFIPEMAGLAIHGEVFPKAKVQIFIQEYDSHLLTFGEKNYLIPNPEWCWDTPESLQKVDLILARTREVERLYSEKGLPVFYLGFTGADQFLPHVEKKYRSYFHLKGFSPFKSCEEIVAAWNPSFPELIVVDHWPHYKKITPNITIIDAYLTDEEIKIAQNRSGIHLCPSKTEGFGHSMTEAMSAGAVVLTTDAPPMNEFIVDRRFLIPYFKTSVHGWGKLYHVSPQEIRKAVAHTMKLSPKELKEVGEQNRRRYLELKEEFLQNLQDLLTLE